MNEEGITIRNYPVNTDIRWWLTSYGDGFGASDGDGEITEFQINKLSYYIDSLAQELAFFSGISS